MDRDGVINEDSETFIKSPDEWWPIAGSLEAIALLNQQGFEVVVISNQSGIARGLFDETMLALTHAKMQHMLSEKGGKITAIYYCPHGPDSLCACRKPKPGLLRQFAVDNHADLTATYFVGDSLRDIQAAQAVSAMAILVKTGKGELTLTNNPNLNVPVFANLYDAAEYIISKQ